MAVAPLTPNEQEELNRLLEENAEIKERIRVINEKIALATGSERDDLEAMAQTGGILVLSSVEDPENYWPYLVGIENCRFRRSVIPGDTVIFVPATICVTPPPPPAPLETQLIE